MTDGTARGIDEVLTLAGFEPLARERLEQAVFDYIAGGSWDEITLRENVDAFRRRRLRPRVLVDVSSVDTSTTVLGRSVAAPVGLAPAAFQGLFHPDGEVAAARAAAASNLLYCLSTLSSRPLEEVSVASPGGPRWFQLYVQKDRGLTRELVQRAAGAGYQAIVLTVDLPVVAIRERDLRSSIAFPAVGNFTPEGTTAAVELGKAISFLEDPTLSWRDLEWIRAASDLPLVIKGVLTGEDALLGVEQGAAGIVVSNHGGRQLDRVLPTIDVLEEIVEAVDGRAEVYLDGGVRRATDVLMALALGARAVFIGRPYLFALAVAGEDGVGHALRLLTAELEIAMALLGVRTVSEVERSHVV